MSSPHPIPASVIGCRPRWFARRGGFALLITITLLAFLVLLLVSLASLTRVETQVAANNAQLAQARANALFALNLAVGQLQKYAGPDQRVTARADITDKPDDPMDDVANPLWTGVWDATPKDASNVLLATPTHNPVTAPASSAPKVWLVSGNETNGTAITPVTAAVADPEADPNNVWLVRKVLGEDLSAQLPDYPQDGRVKLAKSAIKVPASQVPGAAASGPDVQVGAYAWWVGDEGIKAKVNLADPYRAAAADPETTWRRSAPPRPGLELLDDRKASVLRTAFTATTDAFETKRAGLLAYQQFPMLSADFATTPGVAQVGRYSNDLTMVGYGVLADTLRGGLRRDLTRGLAATPTAGSTAATELGDSVSVFTLPTPGAYGRTAKNVPSSKDVWTSNAEPPAPTWSEVRAWAGLHAESGNTMDPVAAPLVGSPCPVPAGQAVMPVPVMLELGYGVDVDSNSKVRFMLRPVVVLMNPYNVSLRSATYSLVYRVTAATGKSNLAYSLSTNGKDADGKPITLTFNANPLLTDLVSIDGTRQMAFNITDAFGPGEVRVYSLPASATADIQIDSKASILDLEPGISTVRAYWDDGTVAPSWYDPANRDKITAQLGHMPQDCPYLTLSLGKAVAGSMPTPSIYARYVETSSDIYAKPYPQTRLSTGQQVQLRTLRFTLRHAGMDTVNDGASDAGAQGTLGMDLSGDLTSGARFLIDNNPRAVLSQRLCGRNGVAQFTVSSIKFNSPYSDIDYDDSGGVSLAYWGGGVDALAGSTHAVLFDVLRDGEQLVSLGRLGQFNWGVDAKHPAYPLGNSFASIFYNYNEPDYGYALNEALWDRFFFSTLPTSLTTRPANLPDSRLKFHDPAGASTDLSPLEGMNGYQLAATRLMIDGAFNINSTSVEAWAAFLGGVQAADYAYQSRAGARTDAAVRAFPRVQALHDPDPTASGQSGNMYEWTGYRRLDATQLKALAVQIVAGIKTRARPARSLAEFMNRELAKIGAPQLGAADVRNQEGIVQAAIDAVVNTDTPDSDGNGTGLGNLSGLNTAKVVASAFKNGDNPDAARGKLRSAGAPGFLMQSDLLSPLAPAMSARSDTFRVRTYGEARNPSTGDINGRAWCEAVVQRMPEFVGSESSELSLGDALLGPASKTFGRKFVIVQFRWLGPDEI